MESLERIKKLLFELAWEISVLFEGTVLPTLAERRGETIEELKRSIVMGRVRDEEVVAVLRGLSGG